MGKPQSDPTLDAIKDYYADNYTYSVQLDTIYGAHGGGDKLAPFSQAVLMTASRHSTPCQTPTRKLLRGRSPAGRRSPTKLSPCGTLRAA